MADSRYPKVKMIGPHNQKTANMANEKEQLSETNSYENLISLTEAMKLSGFSHGHLRLLVRQGSMWGIKIGRNWVTTPKAVQIYLSSNRQPGPKPKQ